MKSADNDGLGVSIVITVDIVALGMAIFPQLMGVGLGDAAATSWDLGDGVVPKIVVMPKFGPEPWFEPERH